MWEKDTTQEALANGIGKKRQTVSQYVNGISEPGYETLVKIADYFDVSIDYLLGRTKTKTPDTTAQAVIDYTGLSEENVKTLHKMSKRLFDDGISKQEENTITFDGNKPFIDCLNDLLEAVSDDRNEVLNQYIRLRRRCMKNETIDFWYVSGDTKWPVPGFEQNTYSDPKTQVKFDNELVEYHCIKIAKSIEESLLKKYHGSPEDVERYKQDIDDYHKKIRTDTIKRNENGTH